MIAVAIVSLAAATVRLEAITLLALVAAGPFVAAALVRFTLWPSI
jgi:hypothetical protein